VPKCVKLEIIVAIYGGFHRL